ncbi:hypothetical protein FP2506_08546 [Fulvimarina pelagi HTCC2506]|uniref:Uncharacterized protein n=1 Tax=Fulvimarina pelagi HTCC2506 TaxID=314231 RepID=Q0G637_9HYPH|nr:hypothetical protein FP2506_08546 [Fulvimarina pelagi HTCC2506]
MISAIAQSPVMPEYRRYQPQPFGTTASIISSQGIMQSDGGVFELNVVA